MQYLSDMACPSGTSPVVVFVWIYIVAINMYRFGAASSGDYAPHAGDSLEGKPEASYSRDGEFPSAPLMNPRDLVFLSTPSPSAGGGGGGFGSEQYQSDFSGMSLHAADERGHARYQPTSAMMQHSRDGNGQAMFQSGSAMMYPYQEGREQARYQDGRAQAERQSSPARMPSGRGPPPAYQLQDPRAQQACLDPARLVRAQPPPTAAAAAAAAAAAEVRLARQPKPRPPPVAAGGGKSLLIPEAVPVGIKSPRPAPAPTGGAAAGPAAEPETGDAAIFGTNALEAKRFEGLVAGISRDGLAMFAENWKLKQENESLKRELDLRGEKIAELNLELLELKSARRASPGSEVSFDADVSGEEY